MTHKYKETQSTIGSVRYRDGVLYTVHVKTVKREIPVSLDVVDSLREKLGDRLTASILGANAIFESDNRNDDKRTND